MHLESCEIRRSLLPWRCRPSVSCVVCQRQNLITYPTALTITSHKNTTWHTTCECPPTIDQCIPLYSYIFLFCRFFLLYLIKKKESEFSGQVLGQLSLIMVFVLVNVCVSGEGGRGGGGGEPSGPLGLGPNVLCYTDFIMKCLLFFRSHMYGSCI